MFFRKKRPRAPEGESQEKAAPSAQAMPREQIAVRDVASTDKPVRRAFPGPRGAEAPLRVAIERRAHAELIAHAKESLHAEICGVLAGQACEDDEGLFVHVEAVIRGTAATQTSTHVTFTQTTWSAIHEKLERDHPELKIVGWYHSHPGFGVEFSDMDLFIQRNFFSGPTQIALVTDPLSGAVGICVNAPGGIEYLPRCWVDGRVQSCQVPAGPAHGTTTEAGTTAFSDPAARRFQELETRIGQLVLALDEQRRSLDRYLLFVGLLVCVGIVAVAGYGIYLQLKASLEPPRNIGFAPVPVRIGDHTALLGVQVVSWQLPLELDAVQQAVNQLQAELEKQQKQKADTNAPDASTAPSPASNAPSFGPAGPLPASTNVPPVPPNGL